MNGHLLWEFETDAGIHAAVTTFEHRGEQYVVALAAGSFFPGTKRGDSVWLFSLNGGAGVSSNSSAGAATGQTELEH